LATILDCQAAHPAFAQLMPFPPAAETASAAAAAFSARAAAVIATNACRREDDYLRIRTEMLPSPGNPFSIGDYKSQGEALTGILLAKAAWIRAHPDNEPCHGTIVRKRVRQSDGSFSPATMDEFATADRAARLAGPTACAQETREIEQPDAIAVDVSVSPDCMRRQINEAVLAMRKTTQLGSSDLPCIENLSTASHGEFDVDVRQLVRLLYMAGPRGRDPGPLAPATVDHMYASLLAARGAPSDNSYSILGGCTDPAGDDLGSPEDMADRHAWYRELADAIGDAIDWLTSLFFRAVGSALSTAAGLVAAPFLIAAGEDPTELILPHADIRVRETENHRLMIETSRFLTNADIIARLEAKNYDHVDDIRADQAEVRQWLLRRLQDIAAHDFQEYNARPYTRYSLNAVLNLHDFAGVHGDTQLATAARIVLDLSAAKFAATSNRGRRVVPFRRLSENDGDDTFGDPGATADLFNAVSGADHEIARAMILSGQTQLIAGGPPMPALVEMLNAATSPYRLPPPVLSAAVERRAFTQTMRHTGVEHVLQSPAFTISAGGVRTGPTLSTLGLSRDVDRGVAVQTSIIPTVAGSRLGDLFRFRGVGRQHERSDNTCVAEGFACGVQPQLPPAFSACTSGSTLPGDSHFFVNSAVCFPGPGPHFYLAARIVDCPDSFCARGRQWGVMEIVEAAPPAPVEARPSPDPDFIRFMAERDVALDAVAPDADGNASYITATGRRIEITLAEDAPAIRATDGVPAPPWATTGGLIEADGLGRAKLSGPGGTVTIDFSDWSNPVREP
jgi:hypothetical protein